MSVSRRDSRGCKATVLALLVPGLVLACAAFSSVEACSTPVHRYALYSWPPSFYQVFCFHRGEVDPATAKVHRQLERLSEGDGTRGNVELNTVDVEKEGEIDGLPGVVQEAWKDRGEMEPPFYVVFAPYGQQIFSGHLRDLVEGRVLLGRRGHLRQQQKVQLEQTLGTAHEVPSRRS